MPEKPEDCSTCRHHSCEQRDKPIAEADFDSLVEFEDDPRPFYICLHPETAGGRKEVGFDPVHCSGYQPTEQPDTSHADDLVARFEARQKKKRG